MTPAAPQIAGLTSPPPVPRGIVILTVALGVAYAVSLLPAVRTSPGFSAPLDGWLNGLFRAGVIAVLVLRGYEDRVNRVAWWLLAAGLGAALLVTVGYYVHYQYLEPIPFPSWSDAGFAAFYLFAYVAVVVLLRRRVPELHRSLRLDGLVAGLTAAAFVAAFFFEPPPGGGPESAAAVMTTLAYPAADVLLLTTVAGGLAVIGRGAGPTWWWLSAGFLAFAVSDALYAAQVAAGTYRSGGLLDIGWTVARLCFIAAALQSGSAERPRARTGGASLLTVPVICAVAALALLFYGSRAGLPPGADVLAVSAVLAALLRMALTFREVETLREIGRQATEDELTGLSNRRAFYAKLRELTGGEERFAVMVVDLDHFKDVNDSLGHQTGDELLRMVAGRLSETAGRRNFLARLGGDEFAVLALDAGAVDAKALATAMCEALREPFALGPARLTIGASVGAAPAPVDSRGGDELLQMADLAMYAAKRRRAGCLLYDATRDEQGRHRLQLAEELRRGIADGQLVLLFQPKLDIRRGRISGVEALVRWEHPTRGLLAPGDFIDVAESSGLMSRLTSTVLDAALGQCRRWRDAGIELTVAVNISPSDLGDAGFPARVCELLGSHGVPAGALVLEMTEHLLMEDRERASRMLDGLREIGAGISIDDFGTGYSSLGYLAELPVTELKLDRSIVTRMTVSARSTAIVRSTVELTHALGMRVVAEGVEDQETLDALAAVGCDCAQGFHLSRPVSAAAIAELIGTGAPRAATMR